MNGAPWEVVILNDHASLSGGASAVALGSAAGLAERGIPVTLFTCVGPVPPGLRETPNLDIICLGQEEIVRDRNRLRAATSGLRNRRALAALREVLARKSPARTLVHVHSWSKALSPYAAALAADMGFKLVLTLHDFFIACPTGGFFVHPTGELCHRRPLSIACLACSCDRRRGLHKAWRALRTALQNRRVRLPEKVSCFVAPSELCLEILRPHLPPGARARVVRNPVECERALPAPVAGNREFLFVGRFEREKGVELFAAAVRAAGVPAAFVGDGELGGLLRGLCPGARFTGWLPAPAIRRELQRARALVFPSLWYETLGLVVIEAAASGVPAIVSDRCAARDHVRHGVSGLHFARGSVEALRDAIGRVAGDDALAAGMGRAAYEGYWRDPWTARRHAEELSELYQDILQGARQPEEAALSR